MKLKFIVITAVLSLGIYAFINPVCADEKNSHKGSMIDEEITAEVAISSAIQVGNAICPISGELISDVGEGNGVQIEHEGKIYNVCCKFCAKDFKKNPEKFIKIIEDNLAEGKDPGRNYESDHDEDLEHDEGDHEESDHGGHDHGDHAH